MKILLKLSTQFGECVSGKERVFLMIGCHSVLIVRLAIIILTGHGTAPEVINQLHRRPRGAREPGLVLHLIDRAMEDNSQAYQAGVDERHGFPLCSGNHGKNSYPTLDPKKTCVLFGMIEFMI